MKKFKDLGVDDIVYLVSVDPVKRSTSFKTAKVSLGMPDNIYPLKIRIFFKEINLGAISVNKDDSIAKADTEFGKTIQRYYFSDPNALDDFLKNEIENLKKYSCLLETISELAWRIHNSDEKTKFEIGKIYFYSNNSHKSPCIISKFGDAYDSDGFRISKMFLTKETIRDATPKEISEFYEKLTRVIKARPTKDTIIENIESCGITWDYNIQEIIKL
jgi:YHS domain-containing protein